MILLFLPYSLRQKIASHKPVVWLLNVLFVLAALSAIHFFLFKIIEKVTWMESLWQTWQTFTTVGYGNRPAESSRGRWMTMLTSTGGIALLGVMFSAIVDINIWQKERRRNGFMRNKFKNGYIVINFPGEATFNDLVSEIRHMEENVGICIVDGRMESLPAAVSKIEKVHFVSGSIYNKQTYENANLKANKVVVIFPVDDNSPDSDGITRTIVDSVNKFVDTSTRIMHVLVDPGNRWMFDNVKSTQVLKSLEILAIVQECQDRYTSRIIEKLLMNTEDANPKTVVADNIAGWTWGDLMTYSIQAAKNFDMEVNLFALVQDSRSYSCPTYDTVIKKGDSISIITHKAIKWDKFEQELLKVKAD